MLSSIKSFRIRNELNNTYFLFLISTNRKKVYFRFSPSLTRVARFSPSLTREASVRTLQKVMKEWC